MTRSTEKLIHAALRDGCREHCDALIDELRRLAKVEAQRDALLEAIKPMIDLAEFWINHGHKGHMCEQEFKVWLALGHESDAMRNARAAIAKAEGENT